MNRFRFDFSAGLFLALSLCLTGVAWFTSRGFVKQNSEERFKEWTRLVRDGTGAQLQTYINALYETRAFLIASGLDVSPWKFERYIQASNITRRFPGIQGVGLGQKVSRHQLAAHEAAMRRQGLTKYRVFPRGKRDIYFPVSHISPFDNTNVSALAYDMFSDEPRRIAMETARDTGEAIATSALPLIFDSHPNSQMGFLIYLPIYNPSVSLDSIEARRRALLGFVYSSFRIPELMYGILKTQIHMDLPLGVELFDGTRAEDKKLIFSFAERLLYAEGERIESTETFWFAGHHWTFRYVTPSEHIPHSMAAYIPEFVLILGVFLTLLWWALRRSVKETQKALEKSRSASAREHSTYIRYKELIDGVGHAIVWTAEPESFALQFVSQSANQLMGFQSEDCLRKPTFLQDHLFETDRARVFEILKALRGSKQNISFEHRFYRADGSVAWFHTALRYGDNLQGTGMEIRGLSLEITKVKEAEQQASLAREHLRQVINKAPIVLFTIDSAGRCTLAEGRGLERAGIAPEAVVGKSLVQIFRHNSEVTGYLARALRGETFTTDLFFGAYCFEISFAPLPAKDLGSGVIGVATDITERKLMEEQLRSAVNLRDEFLSIASHELRTPITPLKLQLQLSLQNYGHLLEADDRFKRLKHSLETSVKQIERLTKLVDNLLDVSRIQQGKLQLSFEITDLCELAREIVERFNLQEQGDLPPIQLASPPTCVLECDRLRVEQILVNLLSNARKYGEKKPVALSLHSEGQTLKIQVRDYGIGIEPVNHTRIFERFERADSPINVSGLGLGLYIVRQIVEAHGGSIEVESHLGQGSIFTVFLPKRQKPKISRPAHQHDRDFKNGPKPAMN